MVTGENHPKTSKTFATSETMVLLFTSSLGGRSVTVRGDWSVDTFHSIPRVLVYSSVSEIV